MNKKNLTIQQLKDLNSLFELVSDRQLKDFGNISASNKSDGSLSQVVIYGAIKR